MDDIESMIEDCMRRESKLSNWEREFIQSIDEWFRENESLTERQEEILTKIWDKLT